MNITNCAILNCDNVGLLLKNGPHCPVSDCIIRDDRPEATSIPLKVVGGQGNMIVHNLFSAAQQIEDGAGRAAGNVYP